MSRITREAFLTEFGAPGAAINTAELDSQTITALRKAGIAPDELTTLSGEDQHINTRQELDRLFDLIDRVDRNQRFDSIDTTKKSPDRNGTVSATISGTVYEALRSQIENGRLGPASPNGQLGAAPTGLPSAEACKKSLEAIAARGFENVRLMPVPYFNQAAPPHGTHPYPKSPPVPGQHRTIKDAGCAPCALAMVDGQVRNGRSTPIAVADFAVQNGVSGSPKGRGTDTVGLAKAWASQHDLAVTVSNSSDQSKNIDVLKAGLQNGGVALVSVGTDRQTGKGHFTSSGHVIVINGSAMKDGEEWFAVANPGRRDQSQPRGDLLTVDATVVQISGAENGVGSVWISRRQLEAEMKQCVVLQKPTAKN